MDLARVSNAEKSENRPGPSGCDENGLAAALRLGYSPQRGCALAAPCRQPILIATDATIFMIQGTRSELANILPHFFENRCPLPAACACKTRNSCSVKIHQA